jgi:alkylresorcinol/alkylpyrone synthase
MLPAICYLLLRNELQASFVVMPAKWYIRSVYTPVVGVLWNNQEFFSRVEAHLRKNAVGPKEQVDRLIDLVRVFMIGIRTRRVQCPHFFDLRSFSDHATAFATTADESIRALVSEAKSTGPAQFDAVIGVSSVGQILPGIADRLATALGRQAATNALLLDVSNGGCTASSRALQLAFALGDRHRNLLIAAVEPTSTLADPLALDRPNWQGICTFGDGAAGIWLSTEGDGALAELGPIISSHRGDADLIRWEYTSSYYRFGVSDFEEFDRKVRAGMLAALSEIDWRDSKDSLWAVHPAGMMLLLSVAKRIGLDRTRLEPSIRHFRAFSNMSSASILHILRDLLGEARAGQPIRWLSMGAGFHVVYGNCTKLL